MHLTITYSFGKLAIWQTSFRKKNRISRTTELPAPICDTTDLSDAMACLGLVALSVIPQYM